MLIWNTLGGALALLPMEFRMGKVWLHGAVGWCMPLSGWRAAYTGDALWLARSGLSARILMPMRPAKSQRFPTRYLIRLRFVLNLARSESGELPQYSNGYICCNPRNNTQMHHYDMNLCYIE